ncbi:MAG: YceI family protein [Acidimicrobiia bacterium]
MGPQEGREGTDVERTGFSASTEVDREDFDLKWNLAIDTGGFVLGNKVRLELEVEAVRRPS